MPTADESSYRRRYLAVAQDVLTAISRGDYSPGDRLPAHTELAVQAGVSRATAREAFLALELVGAVEVRHGDGTFVRGSAARVGGADGSALDAPPQELIESRLTIEPAVAYLAAGRISADRLALLRRYVDEQEDLTAEPGEVPRFVSLGLQFHADLAPGCGNALLADIVNQLVNVESHPLWALVNQQGLASEADRIAQVVEHRAVLDAITTGDALAAELAMRSHLGDLDRAMFNRSSWPTARADSS